MYKQYSAINIIILTSFIPFLSFSIMLDMHVHICYKHLQSLIAVGVVYTVFNPLNTLILDHINHVICKTGLYSKYVTLYFW